MNKKYILVKKIKDKWEIQWRLEKREQAIKALKAYRKIDTTTEYRVVKEMY